MEGGNEREQVLADYGALLRAFLPQVSGFYSYSQDGSSLWSAEPNPPVPLTTDYQTALTALLTEPGGASRVELGPTVAYLVSLLNEKRQPLGALVLLVPAGAATMTAADCAALVLPASRTLERELSLRVRLLEGYRKLSVQAAEERLLHEVEHAVQGPPDCQAMLGRILGLCRHYLQLQTAALLIPGKSIALLHGESLSRVRLQSLLDNARDAAADAEGSDLSTVPVKGAAGTSIGVLVLQGWKGPEFSARRRARVARYVVTHIESVLARAYDGLTGLSSWPVFELLMTATMVRSVGHPPTLMYLDIDRLHVANDSLGRDVGDQVLASLGLILREELAGHATTRIASDRFAALLMDTDQETARQLGERVAARFRQLVFGQGDRLYRPSVSIGIACVSDVEMPAAAADGSVDGGALATAQVACSAAKDRGRDRVEIYQSADLSIVQRFDDIHLVGHISNAIERGRLALLGQPIVAVKPDGGTNDRPYFEVLVRLLGDDGRQMLPAEFLSAAERYQLMEALDRWVVASTLELIGRDAPRLQAAGARFAINLSGQSLGSEPFLGFVQQQLERSGVPPGMVCFEITETVAVANLQRAQTFMQTLRRTGCHFSLDDFGTGLSSFAYLKLFPVDTLKIDGSFIRDLSTNVVSQSMVAAIAEVARVMRLDTVAEFVENEATLSLLGKLGITWAQGYFLGEPALLSQGIASLLASSPAAKAARSADQRRG